MLERMWSKGNTHPLMLGMQICTITFEISMRVSQKTQDPGIPLLVIYPKDAISYYKCICTTLFIATLFLITRTWKQSRCPSTEEWVKKMWHIYTLEYYSAVKKNDILNFACKWMELENTNLSEVTQTPPNEYGMYWLISRC